MTVENNFFIFHEYFYLSMCENNKEEKWFLFFVNKANKFHNSLVSYLFLSRKFNNQLPRRNK